MPELSVIMPVYNAGKYLAGAIDSILQQTFRDFELILINDASTDGSEEIIRGYTDPRIVYVKNEKNLGLVRTLNKAIGLASGKFIARMDNDDIAHEQRFEKQLRHLKGDPEAKMICSPIIGITPEGKLRDHWPSDYNNRTHRQIRRTLPKENCISHPTVIAEASLLKKYRYRESQKGSEDWDLWLRLTRDGIKIIKTDEVLLRYRIHENSITLQHKNRQPAQIKSALVKWRFFTASLGSGKVNGFVLRTFLYIFKDLAYHFRKTSVPGMLRKSKWGLTIGPLKAWRQYRALKEQLRAPSRFFLFFPYSHMGGAEKVHAQITGLLSDEAPFVFFTGLSDRGGQLGQFGSGARLLPVAQALYHPLLASKAEKLIIEKIHSTSGAVVFGANNLYFDSLAVKLKPRVFVADLTHDVNFDQAAYRSPQFLSAILRCNRRVFISNSAVAKTLDYYDENFVDEHYKDRIRVIYNYVEAPAAFREKKFGKPIRVLYVGRDTPEKAVNRVLDLAAACAQEGLPVEFSLVGEIRKNSSLSNVTFHGMVLDQGKLSEMYDEAHFVIITSLSEGFPLSLMEGMVRGCIPLATSVGDIPFHLGHGKRGFLVPSGSETVTALKKVLSSICAGEQDLQAISGECRQYALTTFNKERFRQEYLALFKADRAQPPA